MLEMVELAWTNHSSRWVECKHYFTGLSFSSLNGLCTSNLHYIDWSLLSL